MSRARNRDPVCPRARGGPTALALLLLVVTGAGSACRRSRPVLSRGDASVVLLAPPVPLPPGLTPLNEQEPATPAEAPMVLPLAGSPGLALVGTLATAGGAADDEDVYAIEMPGGVPTSDAGPGAATDARPDAASAPANRALSIELTPAEGLATDLEMRMASGVVLAGSSGSAGVRHGLPNIAVRPGERYLIVVRRARARKGAPAAPPPTAQSATYVLALRETALGAGDEREPNDTLENATALGPAHATPEVAGYFGTRTDRDYYRIPLGESSESTLLSVFLTAPSSVTASLTVFDRTGAKLQSVRGQPGERVVLRNLAPAALSPPAAEAPVPFFFIAAQTEGVADLQHRYVLGVRSEPSAEGEREPNDQPVRATPAAPGILSGFLGAGDVDFFRCEVPAGAELAVQVAPPKRTDVVLELLLPGAARPQRADAVRRGQIERLTAPVSTAGAALVRVQGRRATDYDNDEPYSLTVELRVPSGTAPPPAETRPP
jgi:hypothetical protein